MQDKEADQAAPAVEPTVAYEGTCLSLTGRSTLTYQAGLHPTKPTSELLFRISDNSGKGMWCKEWAPVATIDALLTEAPELSARTFNRVHPGKSINTGGFILAVLKELSVVKLKEESRYHERVPGQTLASVLEAKLTDPAVKGKSRKPKAG